MALGFQPGWKDQLLPEMLQILISIETGSICCQLEEDSSRFLKVNRLEPKPVDLLRGTQPCVCNALPQHHLFLGIVHPPGNMMYRSRSPLTAAFLGQLFDFDEFAGSTLINAVAVPVIFCAKQAKPHTLGKYGLCMCELPLPKSDGMHAPQLVF